MGWKTTWKVCYLDFIFWCIYIFSQSRFCSQNFLLFSFDQMWVLGWFDMEVLPRVVYVDGNFQLNHHMINDNQAPILRDLLWLAIMHSIISSFFFGSLQDCQVLMLWSVHIIFVCVLTKITWIKYQLSNNNLSRINIIYNLFVHVRIYRLFHHAFRQNDFMSLLSGPWTNKCTLWFS